MKRLVKKPAGKEMTDKRKFPSGGKENAMADVSYSAHISNGKSAINSKGRLLREYRTPHPRYDRLVIFLEIASWQQRGSGSGV